MRRNLQMDFQGGMFFGNLPFSSDDRYREFIKEMSAGKISGFFKEYSIVARMAAVSTQLWMESNTEFIQRLAGDRIELERFLGDGTSAGKVTGLSPSLSDPHNRHRTVIVLEFESGLKLVYKPKDLGLEKAMPSF